MIPHIFTKQDYFLNTNKILSTHRINTARVFLNVIKAINDTQAKPLFLQRFFIVIDQLDKIGSDDE